jgi:tetratricopeptide (TPR) repeat protein
MEEFYNKNLKGVTGTISTVLVKLEKLIQITDIKHDDMFLTNNEDDAWIPFIRGIICSINDDEPRSFEYFQQAGEAGLGSAHYYLGLEFLDMNLFNKAFDQFKIALEKGCKACTYILADMYDKEENYEVAYQYLCIGEQFQEPNIYLMMNQYHKNGTHVEKNMDIALHYLNEGLKLDCYDCYMELMKNYKNYPITKNNIILFEKAKLTEKDITIIREYFEI